MTAKRCSFLFRTAGNLFALREADNMLIDGTFKSAPSLFTQMLGINRVFNERWHLPLSCGLLPGNSQVLCTDLFENLNDLAHIDPSPSTLTMKLGCRMPAPQYGPPLPLKDATFTLRRPSSTPCRLGAEDGV